MNRVAGRGNWVRFRAVDRHGRDSHAATVSGVVLGTRQYRDVQTGLQLPVGQQSARSLRARGECHDHQRHRFAGPTVRSRDFGDFEAGRTVELKQGDGRPVEDD